MEQVACDDCSTMYREDDLSEVANGNRLVCESCLDKNYFHCETCDTWEECENRIILADGCSMCGDCAHSGHAIWCEECDYYDYPDTDHSHGGCTCEAPQQSFRVRNDGDPALANDERATVTLPAGMISDEGVGTIARYLREQYYNAEIEPEDRDKWYTLSYSLGDLGTQWQTKQGNYTKRLSRHAHKALGIKIPPAVLSNVGCIARDHSTAVDFEIEVTRNLNLSAAEFGHEESCWFTSGSYGESRCALKSNGGFGLRTFSQRGLYSYVSGRAWVMPLRQVETEVPLDQVYAAGPGTPCNCGPGCDVMMSSGGEWITPEGPAQIVKTLVPTFDTETPDAFIVFNGYGDLGGYAPARIMSHMAGMTYRKVGFTVDSMYINGESGYLVAPEEIASRYDDGTVSLRADVHSNLADTERVLTNA